MRDSKQKKLTPIELFDGGWVDSHFDATSGREYNVYEFYPEHIDRIKAALRENQKTMQITLVCTVCNTDVHDWLIDKFVKHLNHRHRLKIRDWNWIYFIEAVRVKS